MAAIISLLRGINVGGHHVIKMDALRAMYASLKLRNPVSYVQSGNVVFETSERDLAKLAKRIEHAIEQTFSIRTDVILRTLPDWQDVIARNPFAAREAILPNRLIVMFMASWPAPEAEAKVASFQTEPDELYLDGRELFGYFPNGIGRSKAAASLGKHLTVPSTARNWTTVLKLLELAQRIV